MSESMDNYVVPYNDPGNINHPVLDTGWHGPGDGYYTNQFEWKSIPKASEAAGNGVKVSTDALKMFARNLRWLLTPLRQAKDNIDNIKLRPGAFFDAQELVNKVVGGPAGKAIGATTIEFIENAIQAVMVVADELDRLASKYKTEEELNAATGRDLAEHIQDGKAYIGKAVGGAPSVT